MGQYLIFKFFPILQESRVFPLFDDISHMILFTIYLDYSFIGNKSYFRYVVLKILFQALFNDQTPEIYPGLGAKRENPDSRLMKYMRQIIMP